MSLPLPEQKDYFTVEEAIYSEGQLLEYGQACRDAALEEAAVCAWSHYMDTCKANNIAPASSERWLVAGKIRRLI